MSLEIDKSFPGPPVLGQVFPDFEMDSTIGRLRWSTFTKGSWAILFSHPADFTPVCTTELATVELYFKEFIRRGVKLVATSCNGVESHLAWIPDILASVSNDLEEKKVLSYPIVADPKRELALRLGMIDPAAKNEAGLPLTARSVFVVNPEGKLALSILYPATTGRNFDEILRVVDSLILTSKHGVATPAQWKPGDKCFVLPNFSDEQAKTIFPKGFDSVPMPSGKDYMRMTPDPTGP